MFRYLVMRLLALVPLLFLVSLLTFALLQFNGNDAAVARLGQDATQEQIDAQRAEWGLDRPFVVQYADWVGNALHGDLGTSFLNGASVTTVLMQRLPVTLSLALGGLLLAVAVGVPLGVLGALHAGRLGDRIATIAATIGQAVPAFWVAILLSTVFAVELGWLPATGFVGPTESIGGWLKSIALPCIALGLAAGAAFARQTRGAMIGVLQQEYIRTALATGLSRRQVVTSHGLRNASIPIVTLLGFQAAALLGGSIVVERVFALPGLGSLVVSSVVQNDMPMVMGVVMVTAVVVVIVNLAVDLSYGVLNPRVRVA